MLGAPSSPRARPDFLSTLPHQIRGGRNMKSAPKAPLFPDHLSTIVRSVVRSVRRRTAFYQREPRPGRPLHRRRPRNRHRLSITAAASITATTAAETARPTLLLLAGIIYIEGATIEPARRSWQPWQLRPLRCCSSRRRRSLGSPRLPIGDNVHSDHFPILGEGLRGFLWWCRRTGCRRTVSQAFIRSSRSQHARAACVRMHLRTDELVKHFARRGESFLSMPFHHTSFIR